MIRIVAAILLLFSWCAPVHAAVSITFWSHEFGNTFPHAFFTLRGVPDAGGAPVDLNYGFTARSIRPALLFGSVEGMLEVSKPDYIRRSQAQFSIRLSDAQYADILALVHEWGVVNITYNLGHRNCVHFVQEAARRIGLVGTDLPKLIKRPRSYLEAVAAANAGRVTIVAMNGGEYLDSLPPLDRPAVNTTTTPPPVPVAVN